MFSDLLTLVSRGLPSATIEASRLFCWTLLWNGPCISNKAVGHDCLSRMHQNQSKRWRNNKFSKHLCVFQTSSLSTLKARTREWHFTQDFWFINCGHLSCFTMDFISAAAIKVTNPRAEAYPQSISSNISACHAMKQYVSSPTASCFLNCRKYACPTNFQTKKTEPIETVHSVFVVPEWRPLHHLHMLSVSRWHPKSPLQLQHPIGWNWPIMIFLNHQL